jgi:hypothetical protein
MVEPACAIVLEVLQGTVDWARWRGAAPQAALPLWMPHRQPGLRRRLTARRAAPDGR